MKLLVLSFVLLLVCVSGFDYDMIKDEEWLKSYFAKLKKTYDKRIAPIGEKGPGSPVKVYLSLFIIDISEVDDSDLDYTAQFYFKQLWNDPRLRYTDRDDMIKMTNDDGFWTPDIFFFGGRDNRLEEIVQPNKLLRIKPNGEVFYSIRVTVKFSCSMDFHYFPHDTQKCKMRFESYAHTRKDVDMEWFEGFKAVKFSKEITLHNFDLTEIDRGEKTVNVTTGQYKILEVTLTFQRKFGLFAIKLYVPFIILVFVSLLSLWIRAEERSIRFSLIFFVMYIMTVVVSDVSDNIPDAPYTKGSDVWIGFCMSLVFAIFLEFIFVALITGRKDGEVSESKVEILMNTEKDSKGQEVKNNSLKSHLCQWANTFDERNGGKGNKDSSAHHVDRIFRIVFPLIFLLFNIVYWSAYCI